MLDFLAMMGVFKGHFWKMEARFVMGLLYFCIENMLEAKEVVSMAMCEPGTLGFTREFYYWLCSVTKVA